tara:strand:+ start:2465 stop:3664 length:1200 start_codon:yes stop_codon:yes gene_type:complete
MASRNYKFLFVLLSFSGINPTTLEIMDSGYATFTVFKVFSFVFLMFYFLNVLTARLAFSLHFGSKIRVIDVPNILFLTLISISIISSISSIVLSSLVNLIFYLCAYLYFFRGMDKLKPNEMIELLQVIILWHSIFIIFTAIVFYFIDSGILTMFHTFDSSSTLPHFKGFATESSHAAFIIVVTYFCLVALSRIHKLNIGVMPHLLLIISVFLVQSTFGYLLLGWSFLFLFSDIFKRFKHAILMLTLGVIVFNWGSLIEYFVKLQGLADMVLNLDPDLSPYGRIRSLVFFEVITNFPNFDLLNVIFGHGVGSGSAYVWELSNEMFYDGQIGSFIYEFGIAGLIGIFILAFGNFSRNYILFSFGVYALLIFNSNVSGQLYWFVLLCLFSLNKFKLQIATYK